MTITPVTNPARGADSRRLETPSSPPPGAAVHQDREQWASKTEFMLSCMGYAIGLGNVWRFPYLCYRNGGGAFLVPYLLMLFLCGIPLFYMEMNLGQFTSLGCVSVWRVAPLLKGAGYAMIVVNVICTVYYNLIITYPLLFLLNSFGSTLPWESCTNAWNTPKCHMLSNFSMDNRSIGDLRSFKTPADEFFHKEILHISSGIDDIGDIVWSLLGADILVWIIIYLCIMNGIRSVGKVVYFTATFPFVILAVLFVRGITLPGAIDGIRFYITPKWTDLARLEVWSDAAVQIFFSLGPGWGGIINMASYNRFRNRNRWDAIAIPVINCSTSIFAGFVVFSVLGFMAKRTGLPVEHVATGGPGLAFVTYPEAIAMMPWPNLWAVLFFFMLFLLGIDTSFVQIESVITSILDEYPRFRKHQRLVSFGMIFIMCLMSILCTTRGGMYVVQLLDWYAASITVIAICFFELLMVAWLYGVDDFARDIGFMTGYRPGTWWRLCWKYVTPTILLLLFITTIVYNTNVSYNEIVYPVWAILIGWWISVASLMCIPLYAIYRLAVAEQPLRKYIAATAVLPERMQPARQPHRGDYEKLLREEQIVAASWRHNGGDFCEDML